MRVVSSALLLFLLVACEHQRVTPVTDERPLTTRGILADPMPNTPRRLRSPLDSIAPEDPPIPNRGLVLYTNGVALLPAEAKFVGQGTLANGMPGSSIGYGLFGHVFGAGMSNTGSPLVASELAVGKEGWTVAFQFAFGRDPYEPSQKVEGQGNTTPLATLSFSNGNGPLTISVLSASGAIQINGDTTLRVGDFLDPTETLPNHGNDFRPFHHIAVVFSPFDRSSFTGKDAGILSVYINGRSVYSQTSNRSGLSNVTLDPDPPEGAVVSWALFDELFIYKTSLSEDEIRALQDKPKHGLARVWPTTLPLDVSDSSPYVQTRSNASSAVLGTFGVREPMTEFETLETLEMSNAESFTFAGWYFFPEDAGEKIDLFKIDNSKDGKRNYFTLGAQDGLPYAQFETHEFSAQAPTGITGVTGDALDALFFTETSFSGVEVVTAGDAWPLTPNSWHFIAVTRAPEQTKLWIDGNVVGTTTPKRKFAFLPLSYDYVRYGSVPMAWTAAYSRALDQEDLESLRSPGPRVWLDGKGNLASVQSPSGPTGETSPILVPEDYGAFCRYNKATKQCEPLARYGGFDGVGAGREDSIRLSKRWSGRVAIEAPPVLQKEISVAFNVFIEKPTRGYYPGFVRDAPANGNPWFLPWDVRADLACDGKACSVRVYYPYDDSSKRKQFEVVIPSGQWARIALSFDGESAKPDVAVNGKSDPGKELAQLPGFEPFTRASLQKEPQHRVRFGWDIREWWFTSEGPYDIDDIRVYSRQLNKIELEQLTGGCTQLACGTSLRTCMDGGRSKTTVCGECDSTSFVSLQDSPDYGTRDLLCTTKRTFADYCLIDGECDSSACDNTQCSARTDALAKTQCDERQRLTKQISTDRFTCGKCWDYHEPPTTNIPTDPCVWKPPKKTFDLIGDDKGGIHDPDNSPGFDTFICDSGHAVTTLEVPYSILPDVHLNENDQASAAFMRSPNAQFHHANVRLQDSGYREKRSRCTPTMPTGCEECRKSGNPKPKYCTADFKKQCESAGCKVCSEAGQRCNLQTGYPICERCRPNFVGRRALLTPEACYTAYRSMHNFDTSDHSSQWNTWYVEKLFNARIPSNNALMALFNLGFKEIESKKDIFDLEKKGVSTSYTALSTKLQPLRWDLAARERATKQFEDDAGGGSLALSDCVVRSSAFWKPVNDQICVAVRNPNGAACPPINPETGQPESGNGDDFCESGYCGRRLGVCTDGGNPGAKAGRKNGNDSTSSGFSIGVFSVEQKNESSLKFEGHDQSEDVLETTVNLSNKLILSVMGFQFPVPIYDFSVDMMSTTGEDPEIDSAIKLFGISLFQDDPVASCAGGQWEDGKWNGDGECKAPEEFELPSIPLPKAALCKNLAEKALGKKKFKKFHYETVFPAGPIPITVEAGPVLEPCVTLEAGYSGEDLEGKVKVRPSFGVGVEIEGSVGAVVVKAGVRATITAIEVALPIAWAFQLIPDTDPQSGQPLARYSVVHRGDVSIELDLLKVSLALFAEVDLWLFSIEWELTILELKAFSLSQQLFGGKKAEFVLDFKDKP